MRTLFIKSLLPSLFQREALRRAEDDIFYDACIFLVYRSRRLIKEQDFGLYNHCARYAEALNLSAGEGEGRLIFFVHEPYEREDLIDLSIYLRPVYSPYPKPEGRIL